MDAEPWMLISKTLPFDYEEPTLDMTKLSVLVDDVTKYLEKKPLIVLQPEEDHPVGNPELCERFKRFVDAEPVLKIIYDTCKQNINDTLYLMLHFARQLSSYQRICEFLFFYGPSNAGKDVLAGILEKFYGDFAGGVPNGYFNVSGAKARGGEEHTAFLHGLTDKKICIVPDVPKGILNMKVLKPLCEQGGAKTTNRGCNGNPVRSNPFFQVIFFSNHCLQIEKEDDGEQRRVNAFEMRNRFSLTPREGEQLADPAIKDGIMTGKYNISFFHAIRLWVRTLGIFGTNITRSPHANASTKLALNDDVEDKENEFDAWMEATFKDTTIDNALTKKEFSKKFCERYAVRPANADCRMVEKGIILPKSTKNKRYAKYLFPGQTEPLPIGTK